MPHQKRRKGVQMNPTSTGNDCGMTQCSAVACTSSCNGNHAFAINDDQRTVLAAPATCSFQRAMYDIDVGSCWAFMQLHSILATFVDIFVLHVGPCVSLLSPFQYAYMINERHAHDRYCKLSPRGSTWQQEKVRCGSRPRTCRASCPGPAVCPGVASMHQCLLDVPGCNHAEHARL